MLFFSPLTSTKPVTHTNPKMMHLSCWFFFKLRRFHKLIYKTLRVCSIQTMKSAQSTAKQVPPSLRTVPLLQHPTFYHGAWVGARMPPLRVRMHVIAYFLAWCFLIYFYPNLQGWGTVVNPHSLLVATLVQTK